LESADVQEAIANTLVYTVVGYWSNIVPAFDSGLPPNGVKAFDGHFLPQDVCTKCEAHIKDALENLPMLLCQRCALCSRASASNA